MAAVRRSHAGVQQAQVVKISVTVPTVERGLRLVVFCSMAMAGERPSIWSTSGLSICSRNWRAYADRLST